MANLKDVKQYYIAYFDILGYKNFFEDENNDIREFLHNVIHVCKETQEKAMHNSIVFDAEFIVKTFSDNFIIMLEPPEGIPDRSVLRVLAFILARLQSHFLENYHILIRGGITKGDAYIDNDIVFGKGLIRAVELESSAVFPRIIIDKDTFLEKDCNYLLSKMVAKDNDGKFFVDYFQPIFEDETRVEVVRKVVKKLVKKYGKYNRKTKDEKKLYEAEKTISKYAWLLCQFNEKCLEYGLNPIDYSLVFYYQIMKTEIEIK